MGRTGLKMFGDQSDMVRWLERFDPEALNFVRVCSACRHYDSCSRKERFGRESIAGGCDDWIDAETGAPWKSSNR